MHALCYLVRRYLPLLHTNDGIMDAPCISEVAYSDATMATEENILCERHQELLHELALFSTTRTCMLRNFGIYCQRFGLLLIFQENHTKAIDAFLISYASLERHTGCGGREHLLLNHWDTKPQ